MWGHEPRSRGHLQELEMARKWILLQNHQKKYSPADPVILAQRDPCKLLIPRTVAHLHCFKPLHVCWSVTAVIGNEHNMPRALKLPLPHDIFKEGTEQGARARFPHNWNQSKPHTRKIYAWDEKLTLDFSHGVCLSKTYLVFCFCFILKEYTEMLNFWGGRFLTFFWWLSNKQWQMIATAVMRGFPGSSAEKKEQEQGALYTLGQHMHLW